MANAYWDFVAIPATIVEMKLNTQAIQITMKEYP